MVPTGLGSRKRLGDKRKVFLSPTSVSYFSVAAIKHRDRDNLYIKGFILAYGLRKLRIMAESQQQATDMATGSRSQEHRF